MSTGGRITIVQQNDTHAQLELHWESFWRNGDLELRRAGGYARAASIVQRIREETSGRCLFIDCGDAIHGTGPAQWTQGAAVVPALNAAGVDAFVPGNWEFGFGPDALRDRVRDMRFPVLACNVDDASTGEPTFAASEVREVGGLRIGLIGVTSPIVAETMPQSFGRGLRFTDPREAVPPHVHRLRQEEEVDLVVVLSHVGFPQDVRLARETTGIDVILSGHTHNRLARPVRAGGTWITQSGFSGSFLGRLDVEVRDGSLCAFDHHWIEVDESIVPDAATVRVIDEQLGPFRGRLAEVVGRTATPLHRMHLLESTMDNLITDAYRDVTGADVALSHGWRYGAPIPPGDVTVGDLWQMIPTNPALFTVELTGAAILSLLEANLEHVFAGDAFRQKGGYVVRASGLNAIVRINNPSGTRVEHLDVAGTPVDLDRRYVVAAAGSQDVKSGRHQRPTGLRAIDALRDYLHRHWPVEASLTHRRFVAA